MTTNRTMPTPSSAEGEQFLCDDWFDPLENGVRTRIRGFIEELLEAELDAALGRARYECSGAGGGGSPESSAGSRHGHRERRIRYIVQPLLCGLSENLNMRKKLTDIKQVVK